MLDAFMEPLYLPLLSGKTRFIKQLHIDEGGQLRCHLVTSDIQSANYVALSYTWGNPENPMWSNSASDDGGSRLQCTLLVNDRHTVIIGDNLFSALTSTQLLGYFEGESRTDNAIWVDMICINQSDVQERGVQTNQMDMVYTNARCVFIWLGEEDSTTPRVTEMINKIGALAFVEGEKERRLTKYPSAPSDPADDRLSASEVGRLGLEDVTMDDWKMLCAFYQRTWFQRVWTVQESTLSIGNWILWGSFILDWPSLCRTAFFLMEPSIGLAVRMELGHKRPVNMRVLVAAQTQFVVDGCLQKADFYGWSLIWHGTEDISGKATLILDLLLDLTSGHSASDHRDKVFALLGILKRICRDFDIEPTRITADYSMSVTQVFQRTTKAILLDSASLGILSRSRGPRSSRLSGLPSWGCDYSCLKVTESLLDWQGSDGISPHQPPFKSSGTVKLGFSIEGQRLQVNRWLFSTVVCTGQTCCAKQEKLHFEHDALLITTRMNMGVIAGDAVRELCSVFEAAVLALYGTESNNMEVKFCNYILANCLDLGFVQCFRGMSLIETLERESPGLCLILLSETKGWMPTLAEVGEYFHDISQIAKTYPDDEAVKAALMPELDSLWDHFLGIAGCLLQGRRLFLLENGRFGLGHEDIEIGDQICIVTDGVRMPLILRAIEGQQNEYHLIGEAFVDGIMYGEALEMKEKRNEMWEKVCLV